MTFLETPRERAGLLILVLAAGILFAVAPFISGLLGAAVLYVIFVRLYRRLERRMRPAAAAVITLVVAIIIVAVPLGWLIGVVVAQAPDALRALQSSAVFARVSELRVGNLEVGAEVAKASGTIATWLSARLFSFVGSATSAVLNLVIAFFGLYYMLRSDENTWGVIQPYIPFSPPTADALRDRFVSVTEATILGTMLIAVIQGTLVGTGFWIVGLPNPFFWGTVTAIASILPVLGTALVWLPAVLVLLVQNRYGAAITMLVIGAGIASNIDNVIRPLVYRRVSHIHPMITLVGAFAGVKYFGLLGVLLGPLAIAYLFALLQFYSEEYGAHPAGSRV
ncbi:MAG TPA: AI-2E family transporter [Gemmatimonadaceae bacterium]|nr:AI-2E family transporter [Gemmatimonadaceae bacterium]